MGAVEMEALSSPHFAAPFIVRLIFLLYGPNIYLSVIGILRVIDVKAALLVFRKRTEITIFEENERRIPNLICVAQICNLAPSQTSTEE